MLLLFYTSSFHSALGPSWEPETLWAVMKRRAGRASGETLKLLTVSGFICTERHGKLFQLLSLRRRSLKRKREKTSQSCSLSKTTEQLCCDVGYYGNDLPHWSSCWSSSLFDISVLNLSNMCFLFKTQIIPNIEAFKEQSYWSCARL